MSTVEQMQERDQLLSAQNEMLKVDKTNLQRKIAELDDMVKKLRGAQTTQPRVQQQMNSLLRSSNIDFSKRVTNSEKQLLRVNDELSRYYKSESSHPPLAKLDELYLREVTHHLPNWMDMALKLCLDIDQPLGHSFVFKF